MKALKGLGMVTINHDKILPMWQERVSKMRRGRVAGKGGVDREEQRDCRERAGQGRMRRKAVSEGDREREEGREGNFGGR
jgi:hypothetical protein